MVFPKEYNDFMEDIDKRVSEAPLQEKESVIQEGLEYKKNVFKQLNWIDLDSKEVNYIQDETLEFWLRSPCPLSFDIQYEKKDEDIHFEVNISGIQVMDMELYEGNVTGLEIKDDKVFSIFDDNRILTGLYAKNFKGINKIEIFAKEGFYHININGYHVHKYSIPSDHFKVTTD
jgi:hypothetical protein